MPRVVAVVAVFLLAVTVRAQRVDSSLAAYIDSIRAIDNHAHVVAPDLEHDRGFDALPCDTLPAGPALPPAMVRPESRGVPPNRSVRLQPDDAAKTRARAREGEKYFSWVLDQAGIDITLANRVSMAPGLTAPRFLWVPYADPLLFPLDNSAEKARTPDRKVLYGLEEALLKTYLKDGPVNGLPSTLDHYLEFVAYTLQQQRKAGAVAIKFEAAYLRTLDFAPADRQAATAMFAQYHGGGTIGAAEYKNLQDFLFRTIAAEAGRNGLAVHIHTGAGCGDYFDVPGGQPVLLSSVLNDASLRSTNFVLLHGGFPFDRTIAPLILKPNVYVDVSVLGLLASPTELARMLRPWLENMPEHILFGTDAGPFGPGFGWEETTWAASRNTRRALAIVLTEMVDDKTITTARAKEIAKRVLRDNAVDLYHLGRPTP